MHDMILSVEQVRYTYALRVSKISRRALETEWDKVRWTWNQCVGRDRDLRLEAREDGRKGGSPTGYDLCAELTDWRSAKDWLRDGSQNAQANAVLKWGKARMASFGVTKTGAKRKGKALRPPRFKSRKTASPSLEYTRNGFGLTGNRLTLAGGIGLVVVLHRELPSEPKSATVHRDSCGKWWASFVVERETPKWPAPTHGGIGVDWGVKTPATTTDPSLDLPYRAHARKRANDLAKCQRKMARRRVKHPKGSNLKQSKGYEEAKRQTAKLHAQVARQRRHDGRQWARSMMVGDLIAVEDTKFGFLAKSKMARKAADNSVGMLKRELIRYTNQAGRALVLVPPAYTTMTCSNCDARNKRLPLEQRTFQCEFCSFTADRDRNAARVILAWAERTPVGAEVVRHRELFHG